MDRIDELIAKDDIRELSARYMRGQDRLDADLQRSVFWPDATADYGFWRGSGPDFVDFAQGLLATHAANLHLIGQSLIEVQGDTAFGEVYYFAWHRLPAAIAPGTPDADQDLVIAGRYVDRYERRDGIWKIAHRSELFDWVRMEPARDGFLASLPDALIGARAPADRSCQRDWLRTA